AKLLRQGQTLISFFWPAQNEALLTLVSERGATVVAMDMVPRISRAQKMDALSSMANIAGYRAVIEAGNNFCRFSTGQVTAAGVGAGSGRGALTLAVAVRPEVAEEIESMGAQFGYLDFSDPQTDGAAPGASAAPSSPERREAQLKKFGERAPEVDIVIASAV